MRFARPLAAVCLLSFCAAAAHAAGARFWQVSTQTDFLAGEVENLSIDMHGRLLLGPHATRVGESTTPFLWRLVQAPDGSIYGGSGNDGQVFKFAANGTRTVFFDAPELEVHALAPAPNGGLYVGTSPDGKIYRVDAKGTSTVYFDPEDKYIWSVVTDAAGVLYAATGEKGVIYRITAEGKGEPFYKTKATHALNLLLDRNGDLLAGTEAPGKVFRIRKDGSGFLLLDSALQEISALRLDDKGVVYASAFSGKPAETRGNGDRPEPEAPRSQPVASVSTEITSIAIVDVSGASSMSGASQPASREARKMPRGAVFRIMPDGGWDTVWSLTDDAPYDLLPESGGTLLVATGNKGKIYRLSGEPARATLVTRADAEQVTSVLRDTKGDIWFSTSNPGKLFRLSADAAKTGSYESDVRDAETVATWGAISWRGSAPGGTGVKLFTRSGNTNVPDDTWSPWSSAYSRSEGEQITSPKARYLQWKTELSGSGSASPVVTSVTVAYLQRNLRPEISGITVHPPGVVFQKPFSSGDAELAGLRRGAERPPRQPAGAGLRRRRRVRRQRAAARPPHVPEGPADPHLEGRRRERGRAAVRRPVPARGRDHVEAAQARRDGSNLRVGYHVRAERHLCREDRGLRRSRQSAGHSAHGRAREPQLRHRQCPAHHLGNRGTPRRRADGRGVHRAGRSLAGAARRVLARRGPLAHDPPERRNRGLARGTVRADAGRGRHRQSGHPAGGGRDEQRGDDAGRSTARRRGTVREAVRLSGASRVQVARRRR